MKKFIISLGKHNHKDVPFEPVTVKAKTWMKAVTKAIKDKSIPENAYSLHILEVQEEEDNEEEENLLALHFRE